MRKNANSRLLNMHEHEGRLLSATSSLEWRRRRDDDLAGSVWQMWHHNRDTEMVFFLSLIPRHFGILVCVHSIDHRECIDYRSFAQFQTVGICGTRNLHHLWHRLHTLKRRYEIRSIADIDRRSTIRDRKLCRESLKLIHDSRTNIVLLEFQLQLEFV